ncbi:TonB-dependent receptor [Flavitalea sp. BT771]|uniref:TonB-dependent receptor n=1 Tax=Flavitalea sp. BT771 TaxID=3063329 RepID=UPI0026E16F5E|nr:TonB-dependent receptor [Flavitalea sp. BT771]MDO6430733.1 TonB-dependent receptor [Flavitalea sp. BT771]MDV6219127.1 TonB-dependent receptor [Flavitalea sp. BT771]
MREILKNAALFQRRLLPILFFFIALPGAYAMPQPEVPGLQSVVSISGQHIPVAQVLRAIRKQTGLSFFYSNQLLNDKEKVSISFRNARLEEVLTYLFRDRNITYEVRGHRVLLNEKPAPPKVVKDPPPPAPEKKVLDTITVRGQVMDPDGKPLQGATVMVRGRATGGVMTDEFGIFSLRANAGEVLSVSMVGMQQEEIAVPAKGNLKVTLKTKTDKMNEAVVVGYGKQRKISVTGSVASVDMEDMRMPVRNLTNALAGKVAGVISVQTSGEPGYDNSTFTIRGIGTFQGNVSPLIIVDGVQREDVNSTYGGAYNNIDPEDIASISLLKDASATAVYGAKAANGVLIITTKRGVAGKPKISSKLESGVSGLTKVPKMMDGVNYMKLYNEAVVNDGGLPKYSDETIQKTASGLDPYIYPNVNWLKSMYKTWAPYYNANVNVTGGGESMRYFLSASFYDQDGSYKVEKLNGYNPNLNFKRYDFRSNVDVNLSKNTVLSLNLDAMLVNSRYPGVSAASIWYSAYATNPIAFPIKYPGNKWAGPVNNGGTNPFNALQNAGYTTEFRPTVQSVITLAQKLDVITKGLSAMGRFSFDSYGQTDIERKGNNDLWYASTRDGEGNLILNQARVGDTYLGYKSTTQAERTMYLEANLSYSRSFGDHSVGGLLVFNQRNRVVGSADNVVHVLPYRNMASAGRATYAYKDKYLAEFNAGYTGSENFSEGHRWGFFPSVSAGWVISKEDFFDPLAKTFSLLKIRASRGKVGNDNIGGTDRFGYLTQFGSGGSTSFGLNGNGYTGQTEYIIGTENLTWELATKTDIGLEVGLLNKINVVVDVFQDRRKDILIPRQAISSIVGYNGYDWTAGITQNTKVYANMGEMNNKGIDGSVEYNDKFGKAITLRLFGNFTYARNKILFADDPKRKYPWLLQAGHRYNEFQGYVSQGLFKSKDDINSSPGQSFSVVHPGDVKYTDLDKDGAVNSYDYTYLGKSSFPSWSYGAGFTLGYKKIDLSLFFQGVADVSIMANGTPIDMKDGTASGVGIVPFAGIGQYPANVMSKALDRWTVDNPRQDAYYPRMGIATTTSNNYVNSTWWLKDGSYIRLKQASIGYTIYNAGSKKTGLASLYVYGAGTNLLTFSKFKLWDVELGSNGATYPLARTVVIGLRAQF